MNSSMKQTKQVQHLEEGDVTQWYKVLSDPTTTAHGGVQARVQYTDGGISIRVWDDPTMQVDVLDIEEARAEIAEVMNRMSTELRRVEEMATAVANQSGRAEDRKVAEQARTAATRADDAAESLLRSST